MLPVTNVTYREKDFLAFANEEMDMAMVPYVMSFHEDYFVFSEDIPLVPGETSYPIPYRSVGNKLRDIQYHDASNNVYEMSRIGVGDKPYFQYGTGVSPFPLRTFSIEGSNIVLAKDSVPAPPGLSLVGTAAGSTIAKPFHGISTGQAARLTAGTLPNVSNGQLVYIRAVDSSTLAFATSETGANSSNPADWIVIDGAVNATLELVFTVGYASGENLLAYYYIRPSKLVSESRVMIVTNINRTAGTVEVNNIPVNLDNTSLFAAGTVIDFIQVKSPHKCLSIDKSIVGVNLLTKVLTFDPDDIPKNLAVGDHVALAEECIIPQIPTDLHSMLAQRIACRCLEAMGDREGLAAANAKLAEMELKGGTLVDSRVEDAPFKVTNRHGFLRRNRSIGR